MEGSNAYKKLKKKKKPHNLAVDWTMDFPANDFEYLILNAGLLVTVLIVHLLGLGHANVPCFTKHRRGVIRSAVTLNAQVGDFDVFT